MMKLSTFDRSIELIGHPLLDPLFDDAARCEELLQADDTQFARRTLVRATFAWNEGFLYWMKEHTFRWLISHSEQTMTCDLSKVVLLQDERPKMAPNGTVEFEPSHERFKNYCAFILRTAAECWGVDATTFFGDNGWRNMQDALQVRHRITHPKKVDDLQISDADLVAVGEGAGWLMKCLWEIVQAMPGPSSKPS